MKLSTPISLNHLESVARAAHDGPDAYLRFTQAFCLSNAIALIEATRGLVVAADDAETSLKAVAMHSVQPGIANDARKVLAKIREALARFAGDEG